MVIWHTNMHKIYYMNNVLTRRGLAILDEEHLLVEEVSTLWGALLAISPQTVIDLAEKTYK